MVIKQLKPMNVKGVGFGCDIRATNVKEGKPKRNNGRFRGVASCRVSTCTGVTCGVSDAPLGLGRAKYPN